MNQNSFSPKARWDRFEPDKCGFNPDSLNERIEFWLILSMPRFSLKVSLGTIKNILLKLLHIIGRNALGRH